MILSDISIKRPVLASVMSILLVAFGGLSFLSLPLRELPKSDIPVVRITTSYPGASAEIVESRITQLLEEQVAGLEGVDHITSTSRSGISSIQVNFDLDRDSDAAASDIRDAVSVVANRLPLEADRPTIDKVSSDDLAFIWFMLTSPTRSRMEISDYFLRFVKDRISVIDGVGYVQGGQEGLYTMRIWLDRIALAARDLTVSDVEQALRTQNVELPAGLIESETRDFSVRISRPYAAADDFRQLVIREGRDGHLIRLGEVAKVEVAPRDNKSMFRGNGELQVGIGIIKQSTANTIEVARAVKSEVEKINATLPEDMSINISYDSTIFTEKAIEEVFRTLAIATTLVLLTIYAFLGSIRAAMVPAIVVPVCLIGTFSVLAAFGCTINLMTLLALVLCIGLVVDDSIVVLENIQRRVDLGESPTLAAYLGARQVAFAVIATTIVLVSVFTPLVFVEGFISRIFGELAITIAGAVSISSFLALSLSPMLCSKLLRSRKSTGKPISRVARSINYARGEYIRVLRRMLRHPYLIATVLFAVVSGIYFLLQLIPKELAPQEDRLLVNLMVSAPEGASFDYMAEQMLEIEKILAEYVENGEAYRASVRIPGGWGPSNPYNTGMGMMALKDSSERKLSGQEIVGQINDRIAQMPGVRGFVFMPQALRNAGGGGGVPVQFIISGTEYDQLEEWANIIVDKMRQNSGLVRVDTDYKPTKPEFQVIIDTNRAADLGVSIQTIGQTLETMLGSRRVTTYADRGREYDVILQVRKEDRRAPSDLLNIFVRSTQGFRGPLVPLSNLVTIKESADTSARARFNGLRSITISASLAPGYTLGEALDFLERIIAEDLPADGPQINYKGESARFKEQGNSLLFAFGLALLIVFLVLAAQFESFIHPFVIMLTVPIAVVGALLGLYLIGSTLNIYSQMGLIILIGIAAKNGILIVEFANQLRDQGYSFDDALLQAAETRFRPIVMTGLSTAIGSSPLLMVMGPGSESRSTIGIVIVLGVLISTVMTLFIVPVFYNLLARHTGSPGRIARVLAEEYEEKKKSDQRGTQPSLAE